MAALLGASFMAISAFYIHRRTVDHVLHRIVEIRRAPPAVTTDEAADSDEEDNYDDDLSGFDGGETETDNDSRNYQGTLSRSVDENMNLLRNYRVSSSMPDVVSATEWFPDGRKNRSSSHDNLNSVPLGLPSLRTRSKHGANSKNLNIFCFVCFFSVKMLLFWLKFVICNWLLLQRVLRFRVLIRG
jgi:AMP deaminase